MSFHKLLASKDASVANKALDYLDGKQEEHLINALNDQHGGRKDWRTKGMLPRYRNITKMIVEKSGLLFNEAPRLAVYEGEKVSDAASAKLLELMEGADWVEFFTNLDSVVRMLKTALVLVQDNGEGGLVMDCLHKGNSYVAVDPITRKIVTLIYRVCGEEDGTQDIRVYSKDLIEDYHVTKDGQESLTQSMPNPYGIIPVAVFHDTNVPRVGFWNFIPSDLVQINEMYNFHMIDSEYAASWSKLKTLFTNATINGQGDTLETVWVDGQPLPRQVASDNIIGGGPGSIITLDAGGGQTPFVQYLGPDVNLDPIDNMFARWVKDFAADWSVNVKTVGTGKANSGFQLVVEEADNLQLRKKRSQMFVSGFRRLFEVLKVVFALPGESLYAVFPAPDLPVDQKADEEVWTIRLADGRASLVTYFEAKEGLTRDEAIAKVLLIQEDKQLTTPAQPAVSATPVVESTQVSQNM